MESTIRKQRKRYDPVRSIAIKRTAEEYGIEQDSVRKIIAGTRENEDVKRFYNNLYKTLKAALNPKLKK